ncbi:MAG: putative sulfate/molybdate transporter [Planctomycetes bacterium]|nr:putative sulfate/molybdate transporter [Planctomycetota bacterium]
MTATADSNNERRLRFDRNEAGGALGDLGTFIPLLVGMVHQCGLQIGPALLCGGAMNIVSGFLFRIPMPVQPMKAIAAVAIAEGLNESQILAAGIVTGGVILLLGMTRLIDVLNRAIPRSVVRGLQLALGLKLLSGGFGMIAETGTWIGWDSIGMGIVCASLVLLLYFSTRVPGALVVFAIGLVAVLAADPTLLRQTTLGMDWHLPELGNPADWKIGTWRAALPQIPLTTLNSVIAVCALSTDLFPSRGASPRRVSVSVGLMNLICCPLGGMPMCHGAGGLAAQHRFGARTGGSVILLGGEDRPGPFVRRLAARVAQRLPGIGPRRAPAVQRTGTRAHLPRSNLARRFLRHAHHGRRVPRAQYCGRIPDRVAHGCPVNLGSLQDRAARRFEQFFLTVVPLRIGRVGCFRWSLCASHYREADFTC